MAIQINPAAVSSAADHIDTTNKKIQDGLTEIDAALRTLRQNWEGEAANTCVSKYEYIKRTFSDSRFSVVNGMVSFMRNQVGEGYETTEKNVATAASAFK